MSTESAKVPLQAKLTYYDTKLFLRLLLEEEKRLVSKITLSSDEDEIADADNDLIALRMCLRDFRAQALEQYGSGIIPKLESN